MIPSSKQWTQSCSPSRQVFPRALKPEQVHFPAIVAALSKRPRFGGQTEGYRGYSVAQHCVEGSWQLREQCADPAIQLAFLLHEVSEVFLPDIQTPLKPFLLVEMPDGAFVRWHVLEAQHADVICEALGLSGIRHLIDSPTVKEMDLAMLAAEKRDLMAPEPAPWAHCTVAAAPMPLRIWTAEEAAIQFTAVYERLRETEVIA